MSEGNTGKDNTGNGNSGNRNSGNRNSGDWNSGNGNSGDRNSGNRNSGDWNSGNRNSGNWNSGNGNSGNRNSGDWNSGYGNSTNRESGIFCSTQGKLRMFNEPTDKTWDEIDHPHFNEFLLCEWIAESKMTDKEKIDNPKFHTAEGYLKTRTYQEAWVKFWAETDDANRKKFLALPNFDAEVFLEITGVDVRKSSFDRAEAMRKIANLENELGKLKLQVAN